jgi:competence protein ComEA
MRGFSGAEQRAILFLLSTFGLGAVVWWYRQNQPLPAVNPAEIAMWEQFVYTVRSDSASTPAHANEKIKIAGLPAPRVDLNAATYNDLVRLPGIGPVMAKRIVEYREAKGPFKRLQELRNVKGIGVKTFEKLAPLLEVKK